MKPPFVCKIACFEELAGNNANLIIRRSGQIFLAVLRLGGRGCAGKSAFILTDTRIAEKTGNFNSLLEIEMRIKG